MGHYNRTLSGDVAFLLFTFLGFQKAQVLFGNFESVQIDFYLDPSLSVFSGAHVCASDSLFSFPRLPLGLALAD